MEGKGGGELCVKKRVMFFLMLYPSRKRESTEFF